MVAHAEKGSDLLRALFLTGLILFATLGIGTAMAEALPHIEQRGSAWQLIVDEQPWIALAGEVHNSTASSATYMEPIWGHLAALNLNTVITPAYWELVEPLEGLFDFTLIDEQLRQARSHDMRLVLLWFGSIKNAKSTYAPGWVLADRDRFPRAEIRPSPLPFAQGPPPLSVFSEAVAAADATAFAALMKHLAETDREHTVIAVQILNETGILGDSRDRSDLAERAWRENVPTELMAALEDRKGRLAPSLEALWASNGFSRSGTWAEVFGTDWQAEEVFMAWHVSRLVETIATAGRQHLALPMYANAWIGPQRPEEPAGNYPSGGPVPRVFDVWRAGAPSLSWLSPDIYVDDFSGWAKAYAQAANPLFVPEAKFIVGNLFIALGQFNAIGFAPFGVEAGLEGSQIAQAYGLLEGALPIIADAQSHGELTGFALEPGQQHEAPLGDYSVRIKGQREAVSKMLLDMGISVPSEEPERVPQNVGDHASELTDLRPMGLVLRLGPDEFLVIGKDLSLSFSRAETNGETAELSRVEEGSYVDGEWVPGRVLNGDERLRVVPTDRFGMVRISLINPGR